MAWNPSPEIAILREAARKLNAPVAIMVIRRRDGRIQTLSFGETMALCEGEAMNLGNYLHDAALRKTQTKESGATVKAHVVENNLLTDPRSVT